VNTIEKVLLILFVGCTLIFLARCPPVMDKVVEIQQEQNR
jgi:hypothetical protein